MKKVSVGEVRDVSGPKRGKKKGFVILVVVAVILIALFLIGNTGCSSKKSSTTTTPTPTLLPIPDRVSGLENRVTYLEEHPNSFDATSLWATVNALHNYDDTAILARLIALEGVNSSVNISILDAINASLSYRILLLENRINALPTSTPVATPTPIPTSTNCSLVKKPVSIDPLNGNMSMPNGSIMFQWAECNASGYEFYFGTDPASMTEIATLAQDVLAYPFPATSPNTYYFWRVVALSPCGNQSTMWWFKTQ